MDLVAVLHNLRSVYNVASIFRTADAAGVRKIYLTGTTPGPLDRLGKIRPQFKKVSLGSEQFVEWEKIGQVGKLIQQLKNDDFKIFVIEQSKNSIPYYKISNSYPNSKLCLLLGNEVRGLPPSVLRRADAILEIPMQGETIRSSSHPRRSGRGKESLNVSVAFGIVVFDLLRKNK